MTASLRLHYAPDNASLIVRLALEELRLPYVTLLVDRQARAQQSPEYLRLNPNGTIPVLETPHGVLFETAAILLWLADTTGKLAPKPQDPLRGPFLKWLFWTSNTLHTDLRSYFYPEKFIGPNPADQSQLRRIYRDRLRADLHILEDGLQHTPGLAGAAEPGLLDLYLPCLMRWCHLYANPNPQRVPDIAQDPADTKPWFDLTAFPVLFALCRRAESRASTKRAQIAEGLGPTPFTAPILALPPEGSAT
ncbi:glutathione S-transferase family protein [Phaeobacter sp. B1627]|uniref:glutathione S-transferase family protein n=1 Tax=Phaeobacter sp. B1627 TaxID=2583809 RepID=UPI001117FFCC|nr:glutathione S-transferase family protein [Phaeobacter sp. B1627]TNJ48579.1 glutathione S-transferase family protein [Phaeobacter sp. B1627]